MTGGTRTATGQNPAPTEADNDHDGYMICQGDCDDASMGLVPALVRNCDGL